MTWPRTAQTVAFLLFLIIGLLVSAPLAHAQLSVPGSTSGAAEDELKAKPPGKEAAPEAPAKEVVVAPTVSDDQIAQRLERILKATPDWFYEPNVAVQEGVAFLRGQTTTEERKVWAGELARGTEGVVAVVNLIDVTPGSTWDLGPAWAGIAELWYSTVRQFPWLLFSLGIILVAVLLARLTRMFLQYAFRKRFGSQLLRNIAAWVGGMVVLLGGLYVVLYVAGLTRLALTVLGGTGLIGLVLGIGFRDITENFLASIFLSVQTPFRTDDVVEINGITGIVQRMTIRSTLLMTFQGMHVQIPNSVIYKSIITNFTSNPNRRDDFTVGIGYDMNIAKAQDAALDVLHEHPAVLDDPEPMVLAEALGTSSVTLRVYYWVNVENHSWMKVKSAVIRLIRNRFETEGITIPDEGREIVFPRGIPIHMVDGKDDRPAKQQPPAPSRAKPKPPADAPLATSAEGDLGSDTEKLKEQAASARAPEGGEDLLKKSNPPEEEAEHEEEPSVAGEA